MITLFKIGILALASLLISSCQTSNIKSIESTLEENPQIIFNIIEKNPEMFMKTLQSAAEKAKDGQREKFAQEQRKEIENYINNPLTPEILPNRIFQGSKDAPITIVEYSDFQCGFCKKSSYTIDELNKKYKGKIKFIYKHLPLNFHQQAMITAQYFEAIALQSSKKAFQFHDEVFMNQSKLSKGETFLNEIVNQLQIDKIKLKKDLNSATVKSIIENDIKEANKFGFQGTPGFLINGIPVKGAYPAEHFISIIDQLQDKGKLTL